MDYYNGLVTPFNDSDFHWCIRATSGDGCLVVLRIYPDHEVVKGANVNVLPSLIPAAKSFTLFIGVYIARLLINRRPYR